jgi:hypothetical protein
MDENDLKEFHCEICDKYYSSIQSLSNHRRIKHSNHNVTENVTKKCEKEKIVTKNVIKSNHTNENIQECKYCYKVLANRHSKWRHEQKCDSSNKNIKLDKDEEIQELKKENAEIKSMLMELLKKSKVHPKTLEKINRNLIKNINGAHLA